MKLSVIKPVEPFRRLELPRKQNKKIQVIAGLAFVGFCLWMWVELIISNW